MALKFLTAFDNFPRKKLSSELPSFTDETFKDECDISLMIEKYRVNRIPPRTVNVSYGNSPTAEDYENAKFVLAECKSNFECLPSDIRDEFDNDISKYLNYISDETNIKDCYERGLVDPSSVPLASLYPLSPNEGETLVTEPSSDVSLKVQGPADVSSNSESAGI